MVVLAKVGPLGPVTNSFIVAATRRGQIRLYNILQDTTIPEPKRKHIPSTGTYPKGFRVSGTHVGVKASNTKYPDLALISSDEPCTAAAAVFTTNKFQAAPVQVSKLTLEQRKGNGIQSVLINSGCANAVTGKGGLEDARSMATKVDECNGSSEPSTLVMSTGVIGQRYTSLAPVLNTELTRLIDSPYPESSTKSQLHTPTSPTLTMPGSPQPARSAQPIHSPNSFPRHSPCHPRRESPIAWPA